MENYLNKRILILVMMLLKVCNLFTVKANILVEDNIYKLAFVGEYVDMVKAGIIDPVKVIRTALVDAAR